MTKIHGVTTQPSCRQFLQGNIRRTREQKRNDHIGYASLYLVTGKQSLTIFSTHRSCEPRHPKDELCHQENSGYIIQEIKFAILSSNVENVSKMDDLFLNGKIFLPYSKTVSRIGKLLKLYNVRAIFKRITAIQQEIKF